MSRRDTHSQSAMSRPLRRVLCLLAPAAATLLLVACGSSSSSSPSASSSAPSASSSGGAHIAAARVQSAHKVSPIPQFVGATQHVHVTPTGPVKARPPQPGTIDDEVNASGAKKLDPCSLVSRPEAQAIVGGAVAAPVDAPQGPTCIYRRKNGKGLITLAVQATNFSKVQPQSQLRDRISVTVHGHTAYCGLAGTPTMILPLSSGRFLTISAPCQIAASFAAKALGRI
jgi:hypothetical protein